MKKFLAILLLAACAKKPVVVGSKNFTESVILGELVAQTKSKMKVEIYV